MLGVIGMAFHLWLKTQLVLRIVGLEEKLFVREETATFGLFRGG